MEYDQDGRLDKLKPLIDRTRSRYKTVQEVVLAAIREAILTNILPPGIRLRQEELAAMFGTSRIPIREALRALEYEGLVKSEPNRGFAVTAIDPDDVEEVYELRILLESEAIRLAMPLLTEEDISELDALFEAMTNSDDPDEQLATRERFYLRLFASAGRPRLLGLIIRLRQDVARALRWPTVQYSPTHHGDFYSAVKNGDIGTATGNLSAHYRRVSALIRRYLREGELTARALTPMERYDRPKPRT